MNKEDFLSIAEPDMIETFTIPIINNEPVWKILNAEGNVYVYAYNTSNVVEAIELEDFTRMLSTGELSIHYYVIYLLGEEVNIKKEEYQQPSEKSVSHYCETNVTLGNAPCLNQCKDCELMDYGEDMPKDTIITPHSKTIWDLNIHESIKIENDLWVTHVPGGWLYETGRHEGSYTFVPWVDQKFNTGCVLCGNTTDKTANIILQVLNKLNDETYTYTDDKALLEYVKDYLN